MALTQQEIDAAAEARAVTPVSFDRNRHETEFPRQMNNAGLILPAVAREVATLVTETAKISQAVQATAQDAAAAARSATAADGDERLSADHRRQTGEDRAQTGRDRTAIVALSEGTGRDAAATLRDAGLTAEDARNTKADRSATAAHVLLTADDRRQTGDDRATVIARATEVAAHTLAAKGSSDAAAALAAAFQIDPVARLVAPPTKDIRFQPDVTPAGVTIDRATIGYRTNRFGLLEPIAANGLRNDFDPITGAYLGVMVGPARVNTLTWSEDFSNAAWVKARVSVSADAYRAPDGSMSADKLVESNDNGSHFLSRSVPVTPELPNALSFYARAGERSLINVQANAGLTDAFYTSINLITGAVTGGAANRIRLRKLSNGWWRVSITFTPNANTSGVQVLFPIQINPAEISHQGDGLSGLYLWGFQCEVGSAETSYIKTEGASASRAADSISATIASDVINPAEASFFWEGSVSSSSRNEEVLFSLDGSDSNNFIAVYRSSARHFGARSGFAGIGVPYFATFSTLGEIPENTTIRAALTTNRFETRIALNGQSRAIAHTNGWETILSRLTNLRLGHRATAGNHMAGHQRRFLATPRYLTAAEIEALTRI